MKTISLPADTEHLYLDEVAHLIADCLNPEGLNDPEGTRYKAALEALAQELEQAANNGTLRTRHPETLGVLPSVVLSADPLDRLLDSTYSIPVRFRVVTVPDFAAYVSDRGMTVAMTAQDQDSQATEVLEAAKPETKEQRQDRRLNACEAASLVMPKSSAGRLPDGVGEIADAEGVTRQAFSADVKAALSRRESAIREGTSRHRA